MKGQALWQNTFQTHQSLFSEEMMIKVDAENSVPLLCWAPLV